MTSAQRLIPSSQRTLQGITPPVHGLDRSLPCWEGGCRGVVHAHTHMLAHTCMHAHTHTHIHTQARAHRPKEGEGGHACDCVGERRRGENVLCFCKRKLMRY